MKIIIKYTILKSNLRTWNLISHYVFRYNANKSL